MTINRSYATQLNFNLLIGRCPNVSYHIQKVNLPGLTLDAVESPTPFVKIPLPGDHINFKELMIQFIVNEDFSNWVELFKWITGLGFPKDFKQYNDVRTAMDKNLAGLKVVPPKHVDTSRPIGNVMSPITLNISTSHHNPIIAFDFIDCFPVALSDIEMRTTDSDVQYLTCSAYFRYTSYSIKNP